MRREKNGVEIVDTRTGLLVLGLCSQTTGTCINTCSWAKAMGLFSFSVFDSIFGRASVGQRFLEVFRCCSRNAVAASSEHSSTNIRECRVETSRKRFYARLSLGGGHTATVINACVLFHHLHHNLTAYSPTRVSIMLYFMHGAALSARRKPSLCFCLECL